MLMQKEIFFQFISQVSGTNDYAHLKITDDFLDDSWILRFKFHISELEPHPQGKGVLNIDPKVSQLVFGIISISLPIMGYLITHDQKSRTLGILILVSGLVVIFGISVSSYSFIVDLSIINSYKIILLLFGNIIGIIIVILGIRKIKDYGVITQN